MGPKAYVIGVLVTLLASLAAVAGITHVVDPYGINGMAPIPGFNAKKPASQRFMIEAKAARARAWRPRTLLMGNSRVDSGLDPASPLWPQAMRPIFNDGLPGGGFKAVVAAYRQIKAMAPVETLVVSVDFIDFIPTCSAPSSAVETVAARFTPPLFLKTHLSLSAVADVVATVRAQGNPFSVDMRVDGLNPWQEIEPIYRAEGVAMVVRQRNEMNQRKYRKLHKSLTCADGSEAVGWAALADLLKEAGSKRISVSVFVPPYHADILESFRLAGLWPTFEAFKRRLVDVVETANAQSKAAARLFDFATFEAPTTEAVPSEGDLKARMKYYYEPGHFAPALGELVIAKLFGKRGDGLKDFGSELKHDTIAAHLEQIRERRQVYQQTQPAAVSRVMALWQKGDAR